MKNINYEVIARNIVLFNELKNVLSAFNEKGIKAIVLKGAALGERVYPHLGLRPMEDIDFLIKEEEISQIKKVLFGLGYNLYPAGDWTFIKREEEFFPPVVLDLQEKIWYIPEGEKIREEAIDTEISGVKTQVLSPEEELIYAAAHRVIHHGKIDHLCIEDTKRIAEYYRGKIDWEKVIKKIKKYNLTLPVYFVFSQIEDGAIPAQVKKEIQPKSFFLKKLYQIILNLPEQDETGHLLRPLVFPTVSSKIRFLFNFFFPGKEFIRRRYGLKGGFAVLLFSLCRPLFLLFKATKLLYQFLSH